MSNINQSNLQQGDVVYVPLMGIGRHYGVVIHPATPFQQATIRTVLRGHRAPVDQNETEFSQGQKISILPYPSQLPRWMVVQNVQQVLAFEYCLFTNNCEHFYRRAHRLSNVSYQVMLSAATLIGCVAYSFATKRPLSIKI